MQTTKATAKTTDSTLLGLAFQFDAVEHAELDRRLAAEEPLDAACHLTFEVRLLLAEKMRTVLGDLYDEFDQRFDQLVAAQPTHPTPAQAVAVSLATQATEQLTSFLDPMLRTSAIDPISRLKRLLELPTKGEAPTRCAH